MTPLIIVLVTPHLNVQVNAGYCAEERPLYYRLSPAYFEVGPLTLGIGIDLGSFACDLALPLQAW